MTQLTISSFKGIKLPKIKSYISLLNNKHDANIRSTDNWQSSVKNLRNYLNDNHYRFSTVDSDKINQFINDIKKQREDLINDNEAINDPEGGFADLYNIGEQPLIKHLQIPHTHTGGSFCYALARSQPLPLNK